MNESLPKEIIWNGGKHREKYEPEKLGIHYENGHYVQRLLSIVNGETVEKCDGRKFATEMECLLDRVSQLREQGIDVSFQ